MSMTRFLAISSAAAYLVSPAFGATAVSASMSVQADVMLNGATASDLSTDAWGAPLSSLFTSAQQSIADDAGNSVLSQGYGNAGWSSADAGGVSFEAYSWHFNSAVESAASLNAATPDWSYSFVAGAGDGGFRMAYDVNGYGDTFGLWGWSIFVQGGPEGTQQWLASNPSDPTTSGVFLASLTPGSMYTASLVNNANLGAPNGTTSNGGMNGNFRWEVTPVPEPQTYAMLALGLGLIAAITRRRRHSG